MEYNMNQLPKRDLNELNARIEAAMMTGNAIIFKEFDPKKRESLKCLAEYIIGYMVHSMGKHEVLDTVQQTGEKIMELATQYTRGVYVIRAISTSLLMGQFRCVNIILTTEEDDPEYLGQYHLDDDNGVFGYVYNADAPDLSELGYSFYEKRHDGTYHRIA